ncbi:hypothetical protein [Bacillus subtilis]|uniref:hypothetical protein n=1 Tax=Bacillus subtilis TaxID=1423 RepID=UPI0013D1C5CD|nr:hypothetical protein [Bacillus subtilis]MEC0363667.1 hypothetical protein [Bacillus subtilis]
MNASWRTDKNKKALQKGKMKGGDPMQMILSLLALLLGVIFIYITIKTKDHGKRYVIFCMLSALAFLAIAFLDKVFS